MRSLYNLYKQVTPHILHEICPDASGEEIEVALRVSGGDPNVAAQSLLGGKQNN